MLKLNKKLIQKINLKILIEFDKFCQKNNLEYFIAFGTLLGAVRHGGFIPWDDDIDVLMKRKDYEKLIAIAKENCYLNNQYQIKLPFDKDYTHPFIKIVDLNTKVKQTVHMEKFETGAWIDIFPLDFLPNDTQELETFKANSMRLRGLWNLSLVNLKRVNLKLHTKIYIIVSRNIGFNYKFWVKKLLQKVYFEESDKCGTYSMGLGDSNIFNTKDFEETTLLEFEGYKFRAPLNYDSVLKSSYGDYMKIPPVKDRVEHLIDGYIIDENKI